MCLFVSTCWLFCVFMNFLLIFSNLGRPPCYQWECVEALLTYRNEAPDWQRDSVIKLNALLIQMWREVWDWWGFDWLSRFLWVSFHIFAVCYVFYHAWFSFGPTLECSHSLAELTSRGFGFTELNLRFFFFFTKSGVECVTGLLFPPLLLLLLCLPDSWLRLRVSWQPVRSITRSAPRWRCTWCSLGGWTAAAWSCRPTPGPSSTSSPPWKPHWPPWKAAPRAASYGTSSEPTAVP